MTTLGCLVRMRVISREKRSMDIYMPEADDARLIINMYSRGVLEYDYDYNRDMDNDDTS